MTFPFKFILALFCIASISGCAQDMYPRLSNLTGIGTEALTPEEQQQAIRDLSEEQKAHGAEAAREIAERE